MSQEYSDANLPKPFCEQDWRRKVGLAGATASVVLAIAIFEHFKPSNLAGLAVTGSQALAAGNGATGAVRGVAGVVGMAPAWGMQAAETVVPAAIAGPPVGRPGTEFQAAARVIRPTVVGIRAAIAPSSPGGPNFERIGSGVIVDPSGLVVTSLHVVAGARAIVVSRFQQPDRALPAQFVRADGTNDLALIRFDLGEALPTAAIADSDQVQVGDWVLAVGHPFGLGLTVTAGIVGRRNGTLVVPGGMQYTGLLQTDAPINEGSSGGPLVDVQGRVVGINTAIYAPTGVFSGTGFAISSNRVAEFLGRRGTQQVAMQVPSAMQAIAASPAPAPVSVSEAAPAPGFAAAPEQPVAQSATPWLGVDLLPVTQNMAEQLGFREAGGLIVIRVALNSPADEAQLVKGDVVTGIAEVPVADTATMESVVRQLSPSQVVPLRVWRSGSAQSLMLKVGTRAGP